VVNIVPSARELGGHGTSEFGSETEIGSQGIVDPLVVLAARGDNLVELCGGLASGHAGDAAARTIPELLLILKVVRHALKGHAGVAVQTAAASSCGCAGHWTALGVGGVEDVDAGGFGFAHEHLHGGESHGIT
jgi:hypothetical protein